ncbi:MAG: hypothetical protein OEV54_05820 [Dehalococcoidia bacterium]|nr:hypothetical protein [Dehalococcoidia bacterium]
MGFSSEERHRSIPTTEASPKDSSWFQRHLNWAWVFAYLIWLPLNLSYNVAPQIVGAVLLLFVSGWVIKRKGRSLWWILLTPVFAPLWLKNERVAAETKARQTVICGDTADCEVTVNSNEAKSGTKRTLIRRDKRLEVTIPAGVTNGTSVKLAGALQVTDGVYGDILMHIRVIEDRRRVLETPGFWGLILCIPGVFAFGSDLPNIVFFLGAIVLGVIQLRRHFSKLALVGLTIGVVSLVYYGVMVTQPGFPSESPSYIYNVDGFRELGGNRKPIELTNNPAAQDPSWNQLTAFIQSDTTDSKPYIDTFYWSYVCADYAKEVHNNAEAVGIRAAWVGIDFVGSGPGHALNAFHTTDKGLAFVDSTGFDAIAYVKTGEELGYIDLDLAISPEYSFYEEYWQIWPYPPMGIVRDVQIHWGP